VHGEWRHLRANADLAIATGIDPDRVVVVDDGVVVDLVDGRVKVAGKVRAGYVYVSAGTVGDVTEESLRDRVTLSQEGTVTVVALVDADSGKLTEPPDFLARGLGTDEALFDGAIPAIEKVLAEAAAEGIDDPQELEKRIARAVSRWAGRKHRRNPLVVPVVIEA
jgi:ribonuclease J